MEKQLPAIPMQEEPMIQEYLTALMQNGKKKEVKETKELLDYLDTMEQKVTELINEVSGLKETIQTLQNPETKSRLSSITDKLELAVNHTKGSLEKAKDSFRSAVKQSLDEFKSKGKHAVIKTVEIFHFKQALQHIGHSLVFTNGAVAAFNNKINEITVQSRQIKQNFKNIGRIMTGKEAVSFQNDKQTLTILQQIGAGMCHKIEALYQKTQSVHKKLDGLDKTSVKKELKQIEDSKKGDMTSMGKAFSKDKGR